MQVLTSTEIEAVNGGWVVSYAAFGEVWGTGDPLTAYSNYQAYVSWQNAHPRLTVYDYGYGGTNLP